MSQNFRDKMRQMQDNAVTDDQQADPTQENAQYPAHGNTRNLGFEWPDGKKKFLNYAYLVSGDYSPTDSTITLAFTTHVVTLKGVALEALYGELMEQLPKIIVCEETRYNALKEDETPTVNEITVTEK